MRQKAASPNQKKTSTHGPAMWRPVDVAMAMPMGGIIHEGVISSNVSCQGSTRGRVR